jgi:UDP-N-acetylglucosamine--N-acetylmuramyl-(pentapeptide) pyrophosphoryl-undecaprenol N-acetylglucosamine transferase
MQGETNKAEDGTREFRIIIAGGGTGGHLFPGIAVARELETIFEKPGILFVVGHKRIESEILSRYGYKTASIDVEGLKGRGWRKGLKVLIKLPKSIFQSASLIKDFSPALVLGMGGYSAGPACLAARFLGLKTAIHEQNSYPGLTNRLLSRIVDRVFISFEESREGFKTRSTFLTGNPVRNELFTRGGKEAEDRNRFTILVVGGSQGARAVNRAFVESLIYLNKMGKYPEVIHQTGKIDHEQVLLDYKRKNLKGEVVPFIEDMVGAYNHADLVVSRAGATTIFELAASGKPSVLIPYPHAANNHQEINALSLVRAGGAEMIRQKDLTGEGMARVLIKYMDDRQALNEMGKNAQKIGRPDAAKVILDQLLEMVTT